MLLIVLYYFLSIYIIYIIGGGDTFSWGGYIYTHTDREQDTDFVKFLFLYHHKFGC